ncbi:TRAP transporter small permease subunit [Magnetospirillum fulvum]|uniref:TRAP transporter small permease protein n=1 Tax=Magnetospirillum fulvum TaxID=1082 RepID=A0A1H6GXX6_MAGFU|nr:TRAP transporter small permease subunit [Magnetospirillum fulvum]SEH28329.1 TRAP-type mannitol/chloroaromatic compound transport system, small permease component [Magnetospirillum fulvum]
MNLLMSCSALIDGLNQRVGRSVRWLILAMVVVCAATAMMRYLFNVGSNAWLEVQWYLFAAVFLLGAGDTLRRNEHIRIDILSQRLTRRGQAWVDIIGTVLFLVPMATIIIVLSWPMVTASYLQGEVSSDAGGLLRWPVKLLIPAGFALLLLQGLSELIKKAAILTGHSPDPAASDPGPASPTAGGAL